MSACVRVRVCAHARSCQCVCVRAHTREALGRGSVCVCVGGGVGSLEVGWEGEGWVGEGGTWNSTALCTCDDPTDPRPTLATAVTSNSISRLLDELSSSFPPFDLPFVCVFLPDEASNHFPPFNAPDISSAFPAAWQVTRLMDNYLLLQPRLEYQNNAVSPGL